MPRPPITVTIITLNEENNIGRVIQSVPWAEEVLVVDSGSVDRTREIATQLGARVIENRWPGYGQQKNFAASRAEHDWILSLDADEAGAAELEAELNRLFDANPDLQGIEFPRKTYYLNRWIRYGGWYPNYIVRFSNRQSAAWTEPNLHERLEVKGKLIRARTPLHHLRRSRRSTSPRAPQGPACTGP